MSPTIKLADGQEIPQLGLGVWRAEPKQTLESVGWALEAGYRHIDTAKAYDNEREVGEAVRSSGIPREEVFITTKLHRLDVAQGHDSALKAFDASLERLGFDYVDLYLIHWPAPSGREGAWKALEEIHQSGRAKSIGVSNYTIKHLEELRGYASEMPVTNQVELHPFLYQKELIEYCFKQNIAVEAYSPLAQGEKLKDPAISEIADKYHKSNAQIMLRWSVQRGLIVIPKSVHKDRIIENSQIFDFELSPDDMNKLDALNSNFRTAWDPSSID